MFLANKTKLAKQLEISIGQRSVKVTLDKRPRQGAVANGSAISIEDRMWQLTREDAQDDEDVKTSDSDNSE